MTQLIELIYNLDGLEISEPIWVTPQTYQILIDQAKKEIVRKYGVKESEIRVLK